MRSKNSGRGCVSLVGAGCGSKEWITVEGLALLRSCDVIIYDDLIDRGLLEEVPPQAERVYAGKRSHKPSADQNSIQELLVHYARENKRVVRLKGGDPFVFGRGGEEIQYLNKYQIPWKVVPGISSALAIPAEAGIPVTHRGVSRSIHIMTAHTREEVLRRDMEQFTSLEGTLIFLMGLESLETIIDIMKEKGRDRNTSVAILSGGNASHPYKVTGTLEDILEKAEKEHVTTPGIIVIGDVVGLDLQKQAHRPLTSIRVGLTGTDDFQARLRERLLPLGAKIVSLMEGKCEELENRIPWEQITDVRRKWLVFTSVQGIRYFFCKCRRAGIDHRQFAACRFAVIGAATGKELTKYGFTADLCPREYTSLVLAEELIRKIKEGEEVYLFCSRQGTDLLERRLAETNFRCHRFDIYDTVYTCCTNKEEELDFLLFGSAGGVRALWRSGYRIGEGTLGICVGSVCADAYRECFGREPAVAAMAAVEEMVEIMLRQEQGKEVDGI